MGTAWRSGRAASQLTLRRAYAVSLAHLWR